jgi:hypothetical protein
LKTMGVESSSRSARIIDYAVQRSQITEYCQSLFLFSISALG